MLHDIPELQGSDTGYLFKLMDEMRRTVVAHGQRNIQDLSLIHIFAAAAPVMEADDEEIAQAISVIFLFNVIAALLFPALGGWLGLTDTGFGLFAGTAVNDTSSVTATASTWDTLHGTNGAVLEYATIVKLDVYKRQV